MRLDSTDPRNTRARLLAGATALVFTALALPAFAEEDGAIATALPVMAAAPQAATPPADDGLGDQGYYLEADTLIQDDKAGTITAEGQVQVRNQGRTLRAERVVYNRTTGIVVATGQVVIVERDGTTAFADQVILDDQLRAGVAKGFSARLQDNIKIAGDTLVRRDDNTAELNKGIYTPCEICEEDKTKPPTWSIRADKVVQDGENHLITYQNAVIEMFGIPVFYAPVFWHADPSADRMSGLLPPTIVASERRGLSYEQPYLWVINPYSDLTISPQINTKVNPFLNLEYRQRFYSGQINARFGYTYEKDLDSNGSRIGDNTNRSYILADGLFDIDKAWKWGFAAERASDDLIFDKYDISDVSRQRGLAASDNRRLTSQLFATRQDNLSWFSINAISVQGLRPTDNDRTFPTIAPLIEGRFELPVPVLGGRFRMQGSGVVLTREQSQFVASEPGADSRRATFQADWRTNFTFSSGLRASPFIEARADYYSIADYPAAGSDDSFGRALGVVGVDLTYPLFRRDGDRTIVLEP
ncbi:MAG: LPS-assembly protein LptD, partial [Caulobacteraceae bacterium]